MKSGDRGLNLRMKHAIESTYHKHMSDKSTGTLTEFKFASPVTIKINLGPVIISVGDTPVEFKRAVNKNPLTEEQSAQQQRRRLYKALRELVAYLSQNGVRVTLFFDNVIDTEMLQHLRPFGAISGLSTVFVTDPKNYEDWAQEHKDLIKKTIYVECLWSLGRDLCSHMVGKNDRQTRTNEYQLFMKNLEFQGRGLPRRIMAELEKFYDDPSTDAGIKRYLGLTNPALVIGEDRLMRIRMFGELQEMLDHGWKSLFADGDGKTLLDLQKDWAHDQAKLGVYKILGWIIDQANIGQPFGREKVDEAIASNTHLPKKKREQLRKNLLDLLKQAGKIEVSRRGIDATGILPLVQWVQ